MAERDVARQIAASHPGPRVLFLPTHDRNGMSCGLRAFNVSDALNGMGWHAITLPGKLSAAQRDRILRRFRPDIVVFQQMRHHLNRVETVPDGTPIVLDIDDADFADPRHADLMEDTARRVAGVICGSRFVQDWADRFNANTTIVWTGGDPGTAHPTPQADRRPIVSWAVSNATRYSAEFDFVADFVLRLAEVSRTPFIYRQYGWDGASDHPRLAQIRDAGVEVEVVRGLMPYPKFLASLDQIAVGLAPLITQSEFSRGKSFGKVLGYLQARVPVLCSDAADHSLFFTDRTGVVSNDQDVWVRTAADWLANPAKREAIAHAAYEDYSMRLSTQQAARQVAAFLTQTLDGVCAAPQPQHA